MKPLLKGVLTLTTAVAVVATIPVSATGTGTATSPNSARVLRWSDGDTVVTSKGRVRLIGVDTPEVGRCGSLAATRIAKRLAPAGSRIWLFNPSSVDNHDRYGRLLRYVQADGVDVGLRQIHAGAKARYDGRDGYDGHPRQVRYHRVDDRNRDYCARARRHHQTRGMRSYPPVSTYNCPSYARIKGNASSMIYHMPGQAYYAVTTPEECFATEAGAQAHGYRRAQI